MFKGLLNAPFCQPTHEYTTIFLKHVKNIQAKQKIDRYDLRKIKHLHMGCMQKHEMGSDEYCSNHYFFQCCILGFQKTA